MGRHKRPEIIWWVLLNDNKWEHYIQHIEKSIYFDSPSYGRNNHWNPLKSRCHPYCGHNSGIKVGRCFDEIMFDSSIFDTWSGTTIIDIGRKMEELHPFEITVRLKLAAGLRHSKLQNRSNQCWTWFVNSLLEQKCLADSPSRTVCCCLLTSDPVWPGNMDEVTSPPAF